MSLIPDAFGGGLTNPLTEDLDFDGFKGINSANPSAPQDLATKAYVDSGGSGGLFLPLVGGTMTGAIDFSGVSVGTLTRVGQINGIGGTANLNITAAGSGDLILETDTGDAILNGASVGIGNTDAAGGIAINSVYGSTIAIDTSGSVLIGSVIEPSNMTVHPVVTALKGVVVANPTGQSGEFKAFDVSGIESLNDDVYGLYVNQLLATAGDTYGVYIGDMAATNDAYGIYENADPSFSTNPPMNYFRNNVGIGKDPTEALDVSGNARVTAGNMAVNSYTESVSAIAPAFQASSITSTVTNGTAVGFIALNINETNNTSDARAYGFGAVGVSTDGSGVNQSVASGFITEDLTANGTNGKAAGIIIADLVANGAGGTAVGVEVQGDLSGATSYGIWEHSDTNNTINVLAHPLVIGNSLATTTNVALDVSGNALIKGTLDMSANKIVNVANGTISGDAVNFGQLSAIDPTGVYLPLTGGSLSGNLEINGLTDAANNCAISITNIAGTVDTGDAVAGISMSSIAHTGAGPQTVAYAFTAYSISATGTDSSAEGLAVEDIQANGTNSLARGVHINNLSASGSGGTAVGLEIEGLLTATTSYGIYEHSLSANVVNRLQHTLQVSSATAAEAISATANGTTVSTGVNVNVTSSTASASVNGILITGNAIGASSVVKGIDITSIASTNNATGISASTITSSAEKAFGISITGDISGATGSYGIIEQSSNSNLINVLKHPLVLGKDESTSTANALLDVSGNALIKGELDVNERTKITTALGGIANPTLILESTNDDAPGVYIELNHNSATPAVGDRTGVITYKGNDASGNKVEFGRVRNVVRKIDSGAHSGAFDFFVARNGTNLDYLNIDGSENAVVINPFKNISGGSFRIFDSQGVATNNVLMNADMSNASIYLKNYPQQYLYDICGSYTLNIPYDFSIMRINMFGAGGGGGSGRKGAAGSARFGGGAGSGGGGVEIWYSKRELFPDASGNLNLFIVVGAGGAGGAAVTADDTNGNNGAAGGQTFCAKSNTIVTTTDQLYYQVLGGNGGSGGTNAAGTGGSAPTFSGSGNVGAAGRAGASSSIVGQPDRNTATVQFCGTTFNGTGGSGAGGGISAANVAFQGGIYVSPAGQKYVGFGQDVNTGGAASAVGNGGDGGLVIYSSLTNSAIRPLSGMSDATGGGGASSAANFSGGAGGEVALGASGSRGSGGAGGGAATNGTGTSGKGGRGSDGMVYITIW
jgi:hypothetical protein